MKKPVIIGATAIVLILGGGAVGGSFYLKQQISDALNTEIKEIESKNPGTVIKYEQKDISLLSRTLTLNHVKYTDKDGVWNVDKVQVHLDNVQESLKNHVFSLSMDGIESKDPSSPQDSIHVAHLDTHNFKWNDGLVEKEDGKVKEIHLAKAQFDSLTINNVDIKEASTGSLKLAQMQFNNYGLGRKSDFILKNMEISGTDSDGYTHFKTDLLQFNQVYVADLIGLLQDKIPLAFKKMKDEGSMNINKLEAEANSYKVYLNKFYITDSTKENIKWQTMTLDGLKIDPGTDPDFSLMRELGYNTLDIDGNIAVHPEKSTDNQPGYVINQADMSIKNIGKIKIAFKELVSKDDTSKEITDINTFFRNYQDYAYNQSKIVSIKLSVQNNGLLGRLIEAQSKRTGQSEDQVKEELVTEIQNGAAIFGEVGKQAKDAATDILQNPDHELIITMNPDRPYSLNELKVMSPIEELSVLNIKISSAGR